LRGLLGVLERAADPIAAELELLLALMVRRDVSGDIRGALRLSKLLIAASSAERRDLDRRIRVRAAAVSDHANDGRGGLALLQPLIREFKRAEANPHEVWWGRLQQAIIVGRTGARGTTTARKMLADMRKRAPTEEHKIAALHQLGVLELRARNLDTADLIFLECVDRRLRVGRDDFRLAYEYSRLSEIHSIRRDLCHRTDREGRARHERRAKHFRQRAEAVARRWSFSRFANKSWRS
jgi:hypothetical protein